ncbi:hypothetical protein [Kineosporia succinea]|uniref:Uncharacterized protein n=1 Tax=Kineosporia succinea TaxID=84632 RepID=A0ABT9NWN5_9ACTN|nr:hypothetical protein [Kineosporia succinea]MDP9824415.1 hypothetical protein [Kineosporia succinea]
MASLIEASIRPADNSSSPTAAYRKEIAFGDLAPVNLRSGNLIYGTQFLTSTAGWPEKETKNYSISYSNGAYSLEVKVPDRIAAIGAPVNSSSTSESVSGTARFRRGHGYWGLTCRGDGSVPYSQYEFLLSHTGSVMIREPGGISTGWMRVSGLDMSGPVRLDARCQDAPGNEPILLSLAVNGRLALTYNPHGGLLGPGDVGFEGAQFVDVRGSSLTVDLLEFSVYAN